MTGMTRERTNPVDELCRLGWPADHVTFDPTLKRGSYYIRRASTHDGTMAFTEELIGKALETVASQTSYCTRDQIDFSRVLGIRYRVGWMRRAVVSGTVDLPCGRYPGQRESVRMWVVPEYIFDSRPIFSGDDVSLSEWWGPTDTATGRAEE